MTTIYDTPSPRDTVCGMTVAPDQAAGAVEHYRTNRYFCSDHCRGKFLANPGAYVAGEAPSIATAAMSLSSVSVVMNVLRLNRARL